MKCSVVIDLARESKCDADAVCVMTETNAGKYPGREHPMCQKHADWAKDVFTSELFA